MLKALGTRLKNKLLGIPADLMAYGQKRKKLLVFLAGTALASTALQFTPGLTSKPAKDYFEEQGIPAAMAEEFHTKNIRVYDRYNPLYPVHLGGFAVRALNEESKNASAFQKAYKYPANVVTGYVTGIGTFFSLYIPPYKSIDAFSVKTPLSAATRECFVRPPGRMTLQSFLNEFTGTGGEVTFMTRKGDAELAKVLKDFALLHELRHCDQNPDMPVIINESDADIRAFEIMQRSGNYRPEMIEEARHIIAELRIFNGVRGDVAHMSKSAVNLGPQAPASTFDDEYATHHLRSLIDLSYRMDEKRLKDIFGENMAHHEKAYHITQALIASGGLDTRPVVLEKAREFVSSVEYFNALAEGGMITRDNLSAKIRVEGLDKPYAPVPEKKPAARPATS